MQLNKTITGSHEHSTSLDAYRRPGIRHNPGYCAYLRLMYGLDQNTEQWHAATCLGADDTDVRLLPVK